MNERAFPTIVRRHINSSLFLKKLLFAPHFIPLVGFRLRLSGKSHTISSLSLQPVSRSLHFVVTTAVLISDRLFWIRTYLQLLSVER